MSKGVYCYRLRQPNQQGVYVMKQIIKIIRKVDLEKEYEEMLMLEIDYELVTLFDAMKINDTLQMDKSKHRLAEINQELKGLNAYA